MPAKQITYGVFAKAVQYKAEQHYLYPAIGNALSVCCHTLGEPGTIITSRQFEYVPSLSYGSNGGIYVSCTFMGIGDGTPSVYYKFSSDSAEEVTLAGMLASILLWAGRQVIGENLDNFQ